MRYSLIWFAILLNNKGKSLFYKLKRRTQLEKIEIVNFFIVNSRLKKETLVERNEMKDVQ